MKLVASSVLLAALASVPAVRAQSVPQPVLPSAVLRPGLDALGQGLEGVRVDRWKLPQAARDEVQGNLRSVHRDLESTLPPLLATADLAPPSVAGMLPVSRNITALYDVLLRVEERARTSAPADQLAALEQARTSLDSARRAFDDNLQTTAAAQETQLHQLQTRPAAPPPPPPPPTKKKTTKGKPKPAI